MRAECGVFEGKCFEVSGEGDSGRAEMFLAYWWAIFWTAEASWQAEASGQRRGNSGSDVFLVEFRSQGECFWRARRLLGGDEGVSGRSLVGHVLSKRLLGGFSGWRVSARRNEGDEGNAMRMMQ